MNTTTRTDDEVLTDTAEGMINRPASPSPRAHTISVADGRRETIRISGAPSAPASARRLQGVDFGSRCGLVHVPLGVDLRVVGPLGG